MHLIPLFRDRESPYARLITQSYKYLVLGNILHKLSQFDIFMIQSCTLRVKMTTIIIIINSNGMRHGCSSFFPAADVLFSLVSGSACAMAQTHYAPYIEDIEQRLDKTAEFYQQQKNTGCAPRGAKWPTLKCLKTRRAIRINISARKSH